MKTSNQLPGLLSESDKNRSHVKAIIFSVLSLHVAGLSFLLMQGCRQPPSIAREEDANSNFMAPGEASNLSIAETSNTAVVPSNSPAELAAITPSALPPALPPPLKAQYTIVRGDNLGKVAKLFHTTVKTIREANPGVEPTQLRIGQKLKIPANHAV